MKPITLTLTIELPPDGSPERDQVMHMTLAELLGIDPPPARSDPGPAPAPQPPPVRPHREPDDEPANVQADGGGPPDNAPRTGKQFAGWLNGQAREVGFEARKLAKSKGWTTYWIKLTDEQAQWMHKRLQAPAWGGRAAQ